MKYALDLFCLGFGCIGGASLIYCPFSEKGRKAPRWIRIALWMVGPAAVAWGALGLMLIFDTALSPHMRTILSLTKRNLSGMALGILLLLLISGEFVKAFPFPSRRKS